jgi:hypothetical protein
LVLEKVNEEFDARTKVLVEDLVVESSISDGETGELAGVAIWVLAAGDGCLDQTVFEKLLVEVAGVSAEVSDEVAYFGTDSGVFVADQCVQVDIDVSIVDGLVELLGDPGELGDQTKGIND